MLSKINRPKLLTASAFAVAVIAAGCWYSLNTERRVTSATEPRDANSAASVKSDYGKLPLSFEPNKGQTDREVKFLTRSSGYALFLTPN
jgi:hypothetical protein